MRAQLPGEAPWGGSLMSQNRKATTAKQQPRVQTDLEKERERRRQERRARIQARVAALTTAGAGAVTVRAKQRRAAHAAEDAMDRLNDPDERETDHDLDFD